ncbi:MAG: bifunctional folylpolyglutamate synthase/dihydrofolate synthase, partial [Chloroflexia bacterium]|nr:bifunctional folylpolyglutamate synthase/dihydrofolate synthase [Chloroflexia bacterium]
TTITTLDEAMAAIWERSGYDRGFISNPFAGDEAARMGLVRTARVLELLGNPDQDFGIVHVAGSKGKGSTSSFIDSIVRAAGRHCGRFLSPHLHSYRERFVVDNVEIDEADFIRVVADVCAAAIEVEGNDVTVGQVTAWELSTAMALLWFSRSQCEIAVVEVGLGGTLDATNVVEPMVSVITSLDYEHTAILGSTMAEIAGNKAGIIKSGRPVVCAAQPIDALTVIEARARELGAPLQVAQRDWVVSGTDESFSVVGSSWRHHKLASSLFGQHQVGNAGLAIAAIHTLAELNVLPDNGMIDAAIRKGVGSSFIPGRFEIMRHPSGATFVLDGAHSPASAKALAVAVDEHFPGSGVTVIMGMLNDKQPDQVVRPLVSITKRWLVVTPSSPRALSGEIVGASLQAMGVNPDVAGSVLEAVQLTIAEISGNPEKLVVVVTGSLSTVAEARVALGLT